MKLKLVKKIYYSLYPLLFSTDFRLFDSNCAIVYEIFNTTPYEFDRNIFKIKS